MFTPYLLSIHHNKKNCECLPDFPFFVPFDILQEQLKFIYDTLEEFIVCGYTYFPVKDLSHHLKQKSVRKPGRKNNEYEREYAVRKFIIKHN